MTKYHLYIRLPMPRLHLVFFGKRSLRLVLWLRKHTHSEVFMQESQIPWKATKNKRETIRKLPRAKEIIKELLSILPEENIEGVYEITEEAEQFLRESEEQ